MQLGAGLLDQIDGGAGGQLSLLEAVGCQQYLLREDAYLLLFLLPFSEAFRAFGLSGRRGSRAFSYSSSASLRYSSSASVNQASGWSRLNLSHAS